MAIPTEAESWHDAPGIGEPAEIDLETYTAMIRNNRIQIAQRR
ncbi:MAG: hypothetical protein QGI35_01375 [Arenicellales bacterium]|jgi:hypothetical protein|nr:hypothetical protein [Arenicellales bacterium]MDP6391605.1 hypothetical protein [Arenicellales bacterium]MDP7220666.1 hypothetical protein [Arenicellales bacterium]HJP09905.1 hypothetical protein [Arenicellales bacterium]|tara:strand:+ start:390 stop:518 length:129 start_codon:yes stop_codon:yes gene_type:complete